VLSPLAAAPLSPEEGQEQYQKREEDDSCREVRAGELKKRDHVPKIHHHLTPGEKVLIRAAPRLGWSPPAAGGG